MRQNSNSQSKAVVCMRGVQWVLEAALRGSRASAVAGVAKARAEPTRAASLLILSLLAGPVNAQAPELPPCDPGVQGDPGFDIPNRPAASSAQCASFRASAEIRPAVAAATLLDHASTWVDYFAEEAALYRGGYGRYNELLWADRVAQLAKWRAVFYLGAAGPCAQPFDPMAMLRTSFGASVVENLRELPSEAVRIVITGIREGATELRKLADDLRTRCGA